MSSSGGVVPNTRREPPRDTIIISHAVEDNEFTRWLTLQLAACGYRVWCDLTKLLGGENFWADIEHVIRQRAVKFLYVLSKTSNAVESRDIVRNSTWRTPRPAETACRISSFR